MRLRKRSACCLVQQTLYLLSQVNLTFTIISMLFAVLSKIVNKIGGSAEATADDSVENATNPLGPELPDSAAE